MLLKFPDSFIFGTSTSAYQVETAYKHDWAGLVAKDGSVFNRTTDHEKRFQEDVEIISSLAPHYRLSLMWSKLQRVPYGSFDRETTREYHSLLSVLKERKISLMMVLHHWANPQWFVKKGGWTNAASVGLWLDFARKMVDEFGEYVFLWNTFNEPNLYATLGYFAGEFPPFRKNPLSAWRAICNMSEAHNQIYDYIKEKFPSRLVGVSHNCASFTAQNLMGKIPSRMAHYWYMDWLPSFFSKCDFTGISYYARIRFDPFPITNLYTPKKIQALNAPADDIWEYYPEGLYQHIEDFWHLYKKPIIVTENGICTKDDNKRITAIKDYMRVLHEIVRKNIPVIGYYHWSTWDNFEWTLGMDYQFGLYHWDSATGLRTKKQSADVYSRLAHWKEIEV